MSGVRVSNLMKKVKEKHIKIHFSKPEHGGGPIKQIYFPLHNNDAVVIFHNPQVVDSLLKQDQKIGHYELRVTRLPEYEAFSSMEARLTSDMSSLLQSHPALMDEMKYDMGLEIVQDDDAQSCRIRGNWYQLEYAWQLLDQLMQVQELLYLQQQKAAGAPMEVDYDADSDVDSPRDHMSRSREVAQASVPRHTHSSAVYKEKVESSPRDRRRDGNQGEGRESRSSRHQQPLTVQADHSSRPPGLGSEQVSRQLPSPQEPARPPSRGSQAETHSSSHSLLGQNRDMVYAKAIGAPEHSDDELDLVGRPYDIPFESVHSSLKQGATGRRMDENQTFEKFSGLDLNTGRSPQTVPGTSPLSLASALGSSMSPPPSQHQTSLKSAAVSRSADQERQPDDEVSSIDRDKGFSSLQAKGEVRVAWNSQSALSRPAAAKGDKSGSEGFMSPYTADNLKYEFSVGGLQVTVMLGDLVKETTDAIVNAANRELEHYGGVARAIAKTAGQELTDQCADYIAQHGVLPVGQVIRTDAGGDLRCAHVLHTVGPFWIGNESFRDDAVCQLTQTFLNCFKYAEEKLWLSSLSLPAISTGVYGVPLEVCMKAFLDATLIFTCTRKGKAKLTTIRMLNNDPEATVTSIVLLQTLVDSGLEKLKADALQLYTKIESRELNIPRGRPERSGSLSKMYTYQDTTGQGVAWSAGLYTDTWRKEEKNSAGAAAIQPPRRSSSLNRIPDRKSRGEEEDLSSRKPNLATSLRAGSPAATSRGRERERGPTARPLSDYGRAAKSGNGSATAGTSVRGSASPRLAESPRTSTKRSSTADYLIKTAPPLKQSLTTVPQNRLSGKPAFKKATSDSSSGKGRVPARALPTTDYELSPRGDNFGLTGYRRKPTAEDDDDDEFGTQSLPANLDNVSFREKFLQQSATPGRKSESCAICLEPVKHAKELSKCKHVFCSSCIDEHFRRCKPSCPTCGMLYGCVYGNQPEGGHMMYVTRRDLKIPGYETVDGAIEITYHFPGGKQTAEHPSPGRPYKGVTRKCYLPNSVEGCQIVKLLKQAFDRRLTFTVGQSRTTGSEGVLTWNDIHHKTSVTGGPTKFGYPDRDYLRRVREELAAKGVVG